MSATMNRVILAGNLTRDPDVKELGGYKVCAFTLAVSERFKTRDGQQRERVLFIDCENWGAAAEVCGKYLRKGRSVLVEGKLIQESWEDKTTGQKRSKFSLRAENVQFLGQAKKDGDGADAPEAGPNAGVNAPAADVVDDEDPMPF